VVESNRAGGEPRQSEDFVAGKGVL